MVAGETIRIAHFSDIHITARPLGWRMRDFLTKRSTGWMNLRIGRGRLFRDAGHIAARMMHEIRQRGCQHVVFSGDATIMGFPAELETAVQKLGVHALSSSRPDGYAAPLSGLAVPGNHDYYTRAAVRSGCFERAFAPWQQGERIGEHVYPFAQRVGHCWFIAVNSARANFLAWDSRGQVGREQAERLRELLTRLSPGPRILVTHYPLYLADGGPEWRWRKLRDVEPFRQLVIEGGVSLWLHGHRHNAYVLPSRPPEQPFAVICAGSATQTNRRSYNEYSIEGTHLRGIQRTFSLESDSFADTQLFELTLAPPGK